jgi:hypothetical protein
MQGDPGVIGREAIQAAFGGATKARNPKKQTRKNNRKGRKALLPSIQRPRPLPWSDPVSKIVRQKCATNFFEKYLKKYNKNMDPAAIGPKLEMEALKKELYETSSPSARDVFQRAFVTRNGRLTTYTKTAFDPCIRFKIEGEDPRNFKIGYDIFEGDGFRAGDNLKIWWLKNRPLNFFFGQYDDPTGHLVATIESEGSSKIACFGFITNRKRDLVFTSIDNIFEYKLQAAWSKAWGRDRRKPNISVPLDAFKIFNAFADLRANVELTEGEAADFNAFLNDVAIEFLSNYNRGYESQMSMAGLLEGSRDFAVPLPNYGYDELRCMIPDLITEDNDMQLNCVGSLERLFPTAFTCKKAGARVFSFCRALPERAVQC